MTPEEPTASLISPLPGAEEPEAEVLLRRLLLYSHSPACADTLFHHFKSIGHVVCAEPVQLASFGLTAQDIALLKLVHSTACHMAKARVRRRPLLTNWQGVIDYLRTVMAYDQIEQFRILFLDRKNNLISDELQQRGTVDHIPVYPREVIKRALLLNASAVIVAHNHPTGDPTPSRDDVEMTRRLKVALDALEVELHDHIIIGHGKHTSFRSAGLL
jgi:DNA repair protein RadC